MRGIIEIYGMVFLMMLTMQAGLSVVTAQERAGQAKRYKAETVAEIENSNFNPSVIAACEAGAVQSGYVLVVTPQTYDYANDIQTAEVVLTYSYKIPLFGIEQTRTTRAIAR